MEKKSYKDKRFVNKKITRRIISLHDSGYTVDFQLRGLENIICDEDEPFPVYRDFFYQL